jgi:DNA replication and repair protein RecF
LQGANAQGKTNVLEAIYYLAAAKSPYASSDAQLVNWLAEQDDLPHARVDAELIRGNTLTRIEIVLTHNGNGQSRYRKHIRINGSPKRVMDLLGQANIVLFVPQDVSLIDGAPAGRRRYVDTTLCQIDTHYCRALSQYGRILEQRNSLLRQLRERGGAPEQLEFWDEKLTQHGAQIIARRQRMIIDLETQAQPIHQDLSGGQERLRLRYVPSFDPHKPQEDGQQVLLGLDLPPPISLPQDPERIQEAFLARLYSSRQQEIQRGMTLLGPHRDDLRFLDGQIDLQVYGSRGQQRTAVLAVKLAEVKLMAQTTGEQPILLLDEVMSELDIDRRRYLCAQLNQVEQSLITTTDLDALTSDVLEQAVLYNVSQGRLERVSLER